MMRKRNQDWLWEKKTQYDKQKYLFAALVIRTVTNKRENKALFHCYNAFKRELPLHQTKE